MGVDATVGDELSVSDNLVAEGGRWVWRNRTLFFAECAAVLEEGAEELGSGFGHDSADGLDAVVEAVVVGDLVERAAGTGLGVEGGEDEAFESGEDKCTGAHGAGFERDVHGAAVETPVAAVRGGGCERDHFGVRRWVLEGFALVVAAADDSGVVFDESADWDVFGLQSAARQGNGLFHEMAIESVLCWVEHHGEGGLLGRIIEHRHRLG